MSQLILSELLDDALRAQQTATGLLEGAEEASLGEFGWEEFTKLKAASARMEARIRRLVDRVDRDRDRRDRADDRAMGPDEYTEPEAEEGGEWPRSDESRFPRAR